jgi:hypothetical protein
MRIELAASKNLGGFYGKQVNFFGGMAGTTRLELATSAVTGQRSNQLNYVPTEGESSLGGH